jgi:hypothetical protein
MKLKARREEVCTDRARVAAGFRQYVAAGLQPRYVQDLAVSSS